VVTLEQIRQLETKIGKAIDYVNRVNGENARLQGELNGSEKRVAELEDTIRRFREEQGRIEEGILAALDRLDQFEDAINKDISNVQAVVAAAAPVAPALTDKTPAAHTAPDPVKTAPQAPLKNTPSDEEPPDEEPPSDAEESESGEFGLF
jgi:septal ring factor EnvC (AmiA/AmiB activator)